MNDESMLLKLVRYLFLILIEITILCGVACFFYGEYWHFPPVTFERVAENRCALINEIPSYQRIKELEEFLNSKGIFDYEKKEANPATGSRPSYRICEISINDYEHLGIKGRLSLSFFNNRLMESRFFPSDLHSYLLRLEKENIGLRSRKQVLIGHFTEVVVGSESEGVYVAWRDSRLVEELKLWVKRYA